MSIQNVSSDIRLNARVAAKPASSGTPFLLGVQRLFRHTDSIIAKVVSMHSWLSRGNGYQAEVAFLSQFHIDLIGQSIGLRQHIEGQYPNEIRMLKKPYRHPSNLFHDISDISTSLGQIAAAADTLAALYEHFLPLAAAQSDLMHCMVPFCGEYERAEYFLQLVIRPSGNNALSRSRMSPESVCNFALLQAIH